MAKLTPEKKVKIFQQLNERKLPWKTSRFVINEDDYECLGSGGFAEVYVIEDIEDPSVKYAVKIIGFHEDRRIHKSDIESYRHEPILQGGLAERCSTIVRITGTKVLSIKLDEKGNFEDARPDDSGVDQSGWLVLVMIRMEKLSPVIEKGYTDDHLKIPALELADEKEILTFAIDIAEALDTSHRKEIMHRDVKLENIFFDSKDGSYKLGDFGIARITNQGSASTSIGTSGYAAPEVEGGNDAKYSYQADIYSFGVTVYLLMNELRFPGSTGHFVNRDVQYNPNAVVELPMHGSDELKQLISSLIRFHPSDRPQDMAEVLDELNKIYERNYGKRKSRKTVKKHHKVREEVESIKTGITKTVTDVKHLTEEAKEHKSTTEEVKEHKGITTGEVKEHKGITEEAKEHKGVVGNSAVEVKKEPAAAVEKPKTLEGERIEKPETAATPITLEEINPMAGLVKGILGVLFLCAGLLYFGLLSGESLTLIKTPMVMVSLIANSLVSVAAYFLKFVKRTKMPYLVYFLLFAFSVFVMFTGGMSWFYLILSIGLFLGGVTEVFSVHLSAWVYVLLTSLQTGSALDSVISMNYAWIFFALALFGLILTAQYDRYNRQHDMVSMLLGSKVSPAFIGSIVLIAGVVLFILSLIPTITVPPLLMEMHFIYVGPILWVAGFITRFY